MIRRYARNVSTPNETIAPPRSKKDRRAPAGARGGRHAVLSRRDGQQEENHLTEKMPPGIPEVTRTKRSHT